MWLKYGYIGFDEHLCSTVYSKPAISKHSNIYNVPPIYEMVPKIFREKHVFTVAVL